MPHRYFTNELAAGRAALPGSDAHHLADVMRAKLGEEVVLCGPDGLEVRAQHRGKLPCKSPVLRRELHLWGQGRRYAGAAAQAV